MGMEKPNQIKMRELICKKDMNKARFKPKEKKENGKLLVSGISSP